MACKTCKPTADTPFELDGEQQAILKALKTIDEPTGTKAVSMETGLDSKLVSKHVKTLKTVGLVDSPARCKIGLTPEGVKKAK